MIWPSSRSPASTKLQPATFAKSGSLTVGQSVVAVGAPLGLSDTVTSGIISNTARPVRSGTNNDAVYLAVQTDAAINPGNSGGPLVDLNGSVVGINSAIASTGTTEGGGQSGNIGIGFAIPADVATRVAGDLIENGSRPPRDARREPAGRRYRAGAGTGRPARPRSSPAAPPTRPGCGPVIWSPRSTTSRPPPLTA